MSNQLLLRRRAMMLGKSKYIKFEDSEVERICVEHWSSDGIGLTYEDAAAVTSIGTVFHGNTEITSFDEFRYFTNVTSLVNGAFEGCSGLVTIILPSALVSLDTHSFKGCTSLQYINLENVKYVRYQAFINCSSLNIELNMPNLSGAYNGESRLEYEVFRGTGITSVKNLGSITGFIGYFVFAYCPNLKSATIPSTVTTMRQVFSVTPIKTIIMLPTTPPNAGSNDALSIGTSTKVYVPYGCKSTYIAATYWSSIANQIYELDENGEIPS